MKHKILRLFKIWDERSVYDETFLADLSGLLTAHTKKSSSQLTAAELLQEFQVNYCYRIRIAVGLVKLLQKF